MSCGAVGDCGCGCRHANPRRAKRRAQTMGSGWINSPSTQARIGRESMIRAGYRTGYYRPMVVPMGFGLPPTTYLPLALIGTGVLALVWAGSRT